MSLLVALKKVDSCGFLKQLKGADVPNRPSMHLHFSILDLENGIEGYVRLGVSITCAGKVCSYRKVAPSPGI
jgi:hypothetical protein